MFDRWHHTRDELQEEEQAIFDAALASVRLNLVDHCFHHSRVVAWMDAKLVARELGVALERDCLLGVVSHDVLEHLCLREKAAILAVALEP